MHRQSCRFNCGQFCIMLGTVAVLNATAAGQTTAPAGDRAIVPTIVDLDPGEEQTVTLCNGRSVRVRLIKVKVMCDPIRNAVRRADVTVEVEGRRVDLASANYRLPTTLGGVQIDCPVVAAYAQNSTQNFWAISKAARLRLWPAGSPWLEPATFGYPVAQRWFAGDTQMGNDPCYVGGEVIKGSKIYYHSGLDFGGCEDLVDIVSATEGVIVSVGDEVLPEHKRDPVQPRYDRVHVLDDRGWYVRYSHLKNIARTLRLGERVHIGDSLAVLGKEGTSGGWSHLHFEVFSLMPSGKFGSQDAYAFVWEAWLRQARPRVIAVARPHVYACVGDPVHLDGSRSWSLDGKIARYDWTLTPGRTASGPVVEAQYDRPGYYSEVLRVTNAAGYVAYDFAVVHILDRTKSAS